MKFFLTAMLILGFTTAYTQDYTDSVVRWHSEHTMNMSSVRDAMLEGSTLLFTRKEQIEWRNGRGKIIHTFSVHEVTGTLADDAVDGQIIYQIVEGQAKGTVTISRTNKRETIRVFLLVDAKPETFDFLVKSKVVL